jgi:diaminopimelate epimerase
MSDRHFGVGSDGLILALPSDRADLRMRMFNADGSEGEMCGNGLRCLAKFAFDRRLATANPMRVETLRGVLTVNLSVGPDGLATGATIDMDEPLLDLERIGVEGARVGPGTFPGSYVLPTEIAGERIDLEMSLVSMGSPHAVRFVEHWPDDPAGELTLVGPVIERHPAFPRRINFHIAQVMGPGEVRMASWERGSGLTLACGTGACATVVAGVLAGRMARDAAVHVPGGTLHVSWREADGHLLLSGPAVEVFGGEWPGA